MKRRHFLGSGLALAAAAHVRPAAARAAMAARVRPGQPGWPSEAAWSALKQAVGGRLAPGATPDLADPAVQKELRNPFFIGDQPGLTQSSGWLGAWRSSPSAYVVTAESAADIAAAVRFAGAHNLRLAIKGRGHSYFGASCAPDSLLIWTRKMDGVTVHEGFTPAGSHAPPVPALSAGAGAMWLHAYQAASVEHGRYVQGGGCTTVGVAGLVQGGGFGSFSKGFGTAAASLLEAEIVTADGKVRVVNHAQEPELFWALKGGGGGTFGVVTRLTLATHPLPELFGGVDLSLRAHSNEAYQRLLAKFIDVYAENLCNPHFGEQARAGPSNVLQVSMVAQGLTREAIAAAFKPLLDFASASPADYDGVASFQALTLPARAFWNAQIIGQAPGVVFKDDRPGASASDFWWRGDGDQVGLYWYAYSSVWLPKRLLEGANRARLAEAWYAASRHQSVAFHFNKGLAGAPPAAIAASRDTATNPQVLDAFALGLIADGGQSLFAGGEADTRFAHAAADRVEAAMGELRKVAPGAGAYVNECDYFQPDWQRAFWGPHYPRLLRIKQRYDPGGLFTVHHGVGSEGWSADGFTRTA